MKENKYIINELNEYENPYEDGRAGILNRYNFGKGAECVVYVPEDVNPNTKITVYYPGQNEKADWYTKNGGLYIQNYLENQGNDTIVIMPDVNNSNNPERTELAIEMIEKIKEEYNLTSTNIEYSGWSLGADSCLLTAKKYIEYNPDADPQICVTIDGYASYAYNPNSMVPKIKDTFIENGTILIGIEQPWRNDDPLKTYAKAGINVLKVTYRGKADLDMIKNGNYYTLENSGGYHTIINQRFFKDNISSFITGKTNLPSEGYVYQKYDIETGKWIDIDPSLINTYDKLNIYYGNDTYQMNINKLKELNTINIANLSVTSDAAILLNHVNNIIGNVKNSSFVQSGASYSSSFSSTTKIPSVIPESVQKFYSTTATLLIKIANEVQEFAKIGESFEKKDKELEQEATQLNNPTKEDVLTSNVNNVQPNVSQTNTIQNNNSNIVNTEEVKTEQQAKPEVPTKEENNKTQDKTENNSEQITPNEEPPKVETSNKQNNYQNNNSQNNTTTNTNNNNNQTSNQTTSTSTEQTNKIDDFPDFKEVYSDESRIVYEYKDECRIIIHKNGNEITGIEHYYKFDNENLADKALEILSETYKSDNNIENIIQKGNYIKVIFKDEVYTNMTLDDIKNKYKDLNEIVKL